MKLKLLEKIGRKWALRKIRRLPAYQRGAARFSLEYGGRYKFGFASYGLPSVSDWNDGGALEIGAFCSFAADVKILLGGHHRSDWVSTYPFPAMFPKAADIPDHCVSRGPVVIGSDVWVCSGAVVLSGVRIGDGAVIAAGAVVTRDVPPYAIAAGNPAKVVRFRFSPDIVAQLLAIRWWDWPGDELAAIAHLLCNDNPQALLDYAKGRAEPC
ncbi:CatB-related O-acetyltransferase [Chromobacterium subtsugae]|uniref:CatB-related O-acetyltransferase n=1 Tax=Chromobacterium subtsugae TaxID=251747 RepID=UPI000640CB55|nr:CatB-related O-acetyltransferase [Chromobacterium subtsugae]